MRFGGHTAVCAFAFLLIAQARAQTVEVAPFLDNKQAALSITFDDGLLEHYIVAYPLLRDLGLHATFGLIGSRVGGVSNGKYKNIPCMTWVQAKEMAEHGQEITNHGYAHKNLSLLNLDSMRSEVQRNDTLIYH
ncbi:MAG: polysaccharide deacetylase family protein, partial [Prevotella sp.]|nr:polysaccharide deacetylase family protein [Prevotella sp.]